MSDAATNCTQERDWAAKFITAKMCEDMGIDRDTFSKLQITRGVEVFVFDSTSSIDVSSVRWTKIVRDYACQGKL